MKLIPIATVSGRLQTTTKNGFNFTYFYTTYLIIFEINSNVIWFLFQTNLIVGLTFFFIIFCMSNVHLYLFV